MTPYCSARAWARLTPHVLSPGLKPEYRSYMELSTAGATGVLPAGRPHTSTSLKVTAVAIFCGVWGSVSSFIQMRMFVARW